MYEQSESINELAAALAKAQAEIGNATKDSTNPHFRNHYASLASVVNTILPCLSRHGISIVQMPGGDGQTVEVTTQLSHASGQWIRCTVAARPIKADPPAVGSCVTYLRRYSALAMVGIAPEDDDAEAATHAAPSQPVKRQQEQNPRDNPEVTRICNLLQSCADEDELSIIAKEEGLSDWPDKREQAYMRACYKRIVAGFNG